jgi:heme/copper-type cytochrome/quinol oxidase subunit 4
MSADSNAAGGLKTDVAIYIGILALAGVQILLAYYGPGVVRMLLVAVVQAFFAVMFFMHLRDEKSTLRLALIPATLFVLVMMNMVWADSYRLIHLRPFAK